MTLAFFCQTGIRHLSLSTGVAQGREKEAATAPHVSNNGQVIPDWVQIVTLLANSGWSHAMKQVPAPVTGYGNFKNVPYISFRCDYGGYEINIFGDLNNPAAAASDPGP